MPALRAAFLLLTCLLCSTVCRVTAAQTPAVASGSLLIEATPLLGSNTPVFDGWLGCAVRVRNSSDGPVEGTLELIAELSWAKDRAKNTTRAPFAVPARGTVTLQLPTRGFSGSPPSLKVRALGTEGALLASLDLPDPRSPEPFLFDMSLPSRIAPSLRGVGVPVEGTHRARSPYNSNLAVSSPQVNPASGAAVLPDRPSGYASVTVLLATSQDLVGIGGSELEALGSWLLAGGSLAVIVNRPEDLRHATLKALLGGQAEPAEVPVELKRPSVFLVAPDASATPSPSLAPPSMAPAPMPPSYPGYGSSFPRKRSLPSDEVASQLRGFAGGNLHASLWGASATYGLGEVHLLAFDATREPFVSNDWVRHKLIDLVRHAWQRQTSVALPHAKLALDLPQVDEIRRQIDPNEGTRWTIAVSALLLLMYAVGAGPVNFYLASRSGRPLRALLHLPIWAGIAMLLIVALGILGKGVEGRARRLTLVESGAGMSRAAATRFRGLFSASSSELTVRASERNSVLDIAGESDDTTRVLVVDRDGARLERLRAKPWQTVVIREDGFISLGGGVSLLASGNDLEIKNRSLHDLVGVVVKVPGEDAVYFKRIADGATVRASKGKRLSSLIGKISGVHGLDTHTLQAVSFSETLNEHVPGLGSAWQALETFAAGPTDWWPEEVPVLLGQIEGGEGRMSDSGLKVDLDRVLLRVVGYGGVR